MTIPAKITVHPNREAWLAARQGLHIGSSEAPTCMGYGYEDPLVLWGRKTGKLEPEPESMRLRFGLYAEPFIHDETERELSAPLMDPGPFTVFESVENAALFATPDRFVLNPKVELVVGDGEDAASLISRILSSGIVVGSCSIKTVGHGAKKHWPDDKPALYAFIQAQHEMYVLGLQRVWVSALVGAGEDLRVYPVERDETFLASLLDSEQKMLEAIQKDIPPDPSPTEQTKKALAKLYPEHVPGKEAILPREFKKVIRQWAYAKQMKRQAEARVLALENQIKAEVRDAEVAWCEGPGVKVGVSWRGQRGPKRLPLTDETRLKLIEAYPELREELTHQQSIVRVLRPEGTTEGEEE